jgi:hypothetical protein
MDIVYIVLAAALVAAIWGMAAGCARLMPPRGGRS